MTFQEVIALTQAGWSKDEIIALNKPEVAAAAQAQQPVAQQPVVQQPVVQQPAAQQPVTNVSPTINLAEQLEALAKALQQPVAQQPAPQQPAPQPPVNEPAITPANAGITPEEATKLFQAWSMGAASQTVDLPPTADEVLAKRFNSLYGVDTSKKE